MTVNSVKKTATIKMEAEQYTSQAETYERKLENPELEDYFKTTGVEIIEARYSGGGDSGDIDSIELKSLTLVFNQSHCFFCLLLSSDCLIFTP